MARQFLLRLDDASEFMDIGKWERIERLLDKYSINPIVGVIPRNEDTDLLKYEHSPFFWSKVKCWENKGWTIALHGYNHTFHLSDGGMNPINKHSEFVGLPIEVQKEKITKGLSVFKREGVIPTVFFAPAHTFDINTLKALKETSSIRIISDTIAFDSYYYEEFLFIPQQSGVVRNLPFKTITFCYHPNNMNDDMFYDLENFLCKYSSNFTNVENLNVKSRNYSIIDKLLKFLYFTLKK